MSYFKSVENVLSGPEELHPYPNISYGEYMFLKLRNGGNSTALVDAVNNEILTYNQILNQSIRLAIQMKKDVQITNSIAICSENRLEFVLPALASLYLGVVTAPVNFMYTEREIIYILNISRPKIIFCSNHTLNKIVKIVNETNFIKKIILFGKNTDNIPGVIEFDKYINSNEDVHMFYPVTLNPRNHNAVIFCSSGTTGLPKGVLLTHHNFLVCAGHLSDHRIANFNQSSRSASVIPYFHAYGFVTLLTELSVNMMIVVSPRFEEKLFLNIIQQYRITHLFTVPPIILFLAKHPLVDKFDLSSIQEVWCGAAPLSKELTQLVMKRLNLPTIRQGYGMTETTLAVLLQPPNAIKFGSAGVLSPGTSAKVLDITTGEKLGPNEEGELCFKGDLIMAGYLGDRQATSATIDSEGWIHTGDVGYYDEDGFFFIVDRLKELIKYKGFQVPPAELEAILLTNPAIKDVAVIGIPDETAGEVPLAFVVKQSGANITEEEIIKFVADNVSVHKRLYGGVKFITEIPKNPSGKILRRYLRDMMKPQTSHL